LTDGQNLHDPSQEHWWALSFWQLAPPHRLEDVEEEPEEFQPEVEVEEDPEEVQLEPEEKDPEEVEMEEEEPDEPLEQPQLYDGTVLEADADGDIVIPPAPVANEEAPPAHVDPVPDGEGGDPDDSSDDSVGEEDGDNAVGNPGMMRMKTPATTEQNTTNILLKLRMDSFAFFCGRFCGTWDIP
jgi:hypothetical protein